MSWFTAIDDVEPRHHRLPKAVLIDMNSLWGHHLTGWGTQAAVSSWQLNGNGNGQPRTITWWHCPGGVPS